MGRNEAPRALPECFSRRFRALLALREMKIKQFMRRLQAGGEPLNYDYLGRVLDGKQQPGPDLLARIRRQFDVDTWALLTGAEKMMDVAQQEQLGMVA